MTILRESVQTFVNILVLIAMRQRRCNDVKAAQA
jgi:hypothetical protein